MKASELIQKLQESIAKHGDRGVVGHVINAENYQFCSISYGDDMASDSTEPNNEYPFEIWLSDGV